ncbi:MAG: MoaD/ThiS family protein [Candidatus Hodarchaeota archaeon]
MQDVSCYFFGRIAKIVGQNKIRIQVPGNTVGDLLDQLCQLFPSLSPIIFNSSGKISVQVNILVNGHSVRLLQGRNTLLSSSDQIKIDRIDILETIGGGSFFTLKQAYEES